jgi:TPR repeat protein
MMRAALLLAAALSGAAVAAGTEAGTEAGQPMDAQAAHRLGLMHRHGTGVPQDAVRAAHWMTVAAQGQVPAAMFTLSNMLAAGEGVARDEAAARRWLEAAAALGYPAALQQLALTEPDPRKAELLMRQAGHALQHRGQEQ